MTSVNTNIAAMTALRTLQATNDAMDATQNRVSTGLKIGEAKDNAAYWAISTTLTSDNKSLATVKDALGLGAATVDIAYEGLNSAKDVLDEITTLLSSARQDGVDRTKIQAQIGQLQNQLKSNADSAVFSGENWLSVNSSNLSTYTDSKSIVASFNRAASGAITLGTIDINIANVKLFDANANAATRGILDSRLTMTRADGTTTMDGGINAAGPSTAGLNFTAAASGPGTPLDPARGAKISLGTLNVANIKDGDRLSMDMTVNGERAIVHLSTTGLTAGNFATTLQTAINNTFSTDVTVNIATGGVVEVTTVDTGLGRNLEVHSNLGSSVDGDGQITSTAGINGGAGLPQTGTANAAKVSGGAFTTATTIATDILKFKFVYGNNEIYQAEVQLGGTGLANSDFETLLEGAINNATRVSDNAVFSVQHAAVAGVDPINVTVGTAGAADSITFETREKGFGATFGVYDVTATTAAGVDKPAAKLGLTNSKAYIWDNATKTMTLTGATANTVGSGHAEGASFNAGTLDTANIKVGDKIKFNMNVGDGTTSNTATIEISTLGLTGTTATDRTLVQQRLQDAINAAFPNPNEKVVVDIDTGTNVVTFKHTPAAVASMGTASFISVTSVQGVDGDGSTATTGLTGAVGLQNGGNGAPASAAAKTSASAVSAMVFDADDTVSFMINMGGGATAVTINQANVQAALSGRSTIANAAELALVLNPRLAAAGVAATAAETALGSNILKIQQTVASNNTVTITGVTSVGGGDTMSVSEIDLTNARFTSLSSADQKLTIDAYLNTVDAARKKVIAAAGDMGSAAKRIDLQKSFVSTLMDTIEKGVGNLIDADITEESTRLQALQVKQQLGVQSLSMANQGAQQILRLFQ